MKCVLRIQVQINVCSFRKIDWKVWLKAVPFPKERVEESIELRFAMRLKHNKKRKFDSSSVKLFAYIFYWYHQSVTSNKIHSVNKYGITSSNLTLVNFFCFWSYYIFIFICSRSFDSFFEATGILVPFYRRGKSVWNIYLPYINLSGNSKFCRKMAKLYA